MTPDASNWLLDTNILSHAIRNPTGPNDTLIAAHALALDCTLVTDNEAEFRRVPGLRVENWLKGVGPK